MLLRNTIVGLNGTNQVLVYADVNVGKTLMPYIKTEEALLTL
jgi:hypothetical protein